MGVLLTNSRRWLQIALPDDQYEMTVSMPDDLVASLYPNIVRYGPNGDAVRQFGADAMKVLWETKYDELESKVVVAMFCMPNPRIQLQTELKEQLELIRRSFKGESTVKIEEGLNLILTMIAYQGFNTQSSTLSFYYQRLTEAYGLSPSDYECERKLSITRT